MPTLNSDEKQLLKTLLQPVQKTLRLAWLMSVMNTVLLIGQMWLLAMLFSHLLTLQFDQPNPSLQTVSYQAIQQHWQLWLMGLAVCFVTRPWFGLIRDKARISSQRQSQAVASSRFVDGNGEPRNGTTSLW